MTAGGRRGTQRQLPEIPVHRLLWLNFLVTLRIRTLTELDVAVVAVCDRMCRQYLDSPDAENRDRDRHMSATLTTARVEPRGERSLVCHFDELSENAKTCFVEAVDTGLVEGIDPDVAAELIQYDSIKFVDYYAVQLMESGTSRTALV